MLYAGSSGLPIAHQRGPEIDGRRPIVLMGDLSARRARRLPAESAGATVISGALTLRLLALELSADAAERWHVDVATGGVVTLESEDAEPTGEWKRGTLVHEHAELWALQFVGKAAAVHTEPLSVALQCA